MRISVEVCPAATRKSRSFPALDEATYRVKAIQNRLSGMPAGCLPRTTSACSVRGRLSLLVLVEVPAQRAWCAVRPAAAVGLAYLHYQCVKLVTVVGHGCRIALLGKGRHGKLLQLSVAGARGRQPMADHDTAQILIHDHHRLAKCIEQDGVCRLVADAANRQQLS